LLLNAVTTVAAAATSTTQGGFDITSLLFPLLLVFLVYMMWNNGRKRKRAGEELKNSLGVGAQVILHSGITGTIVSLDDATAVIESTPGTKLRVIVGAIRGIDTTVAQPEPAAESDEATDTK
jgi:preprotein translocase subunit YajC